MSQCVELQSFFKKVLHHADNILTDPIILKPTSMHHETERPLISIVIPCFNHQALLTRAIRSCVSQTYTNFEIIVIDDGSQMPITIPAEFIEHFDKIRLIRTPNQGVGEARNYGISVSKGEYFKFLDADDELLPNCLYEQVNIIKDKPKHICFIGYRVIIGQKQISGTPKFDNFLSSVLLGNIAPLHSGLFPKNLVELTSGFSTDNERLSLLEDHFFHLKLALLTPYVVTLHSDGVIYHKQPGSRSSNSAEIDKARLAIIEFAFTHFLEPLKGNDENILASILGIIEATTQSHLYLEGLTILKNIHNNLGTKTSYRELFELNILASTSIDLARSIEERQFWKMILTLCPNLDALVPSNTLCPTYGLRIINALLPRQQVDAITLSFVTKRAIHSSGIWLWGVSSLTDKWLSILDMFNVQILGIIDSFNNHKKYKNIPISKPQEICLQGNQGLIICSKESYFHIRLEAVKLNWKNNILDYLTGF